MTRELSEGFKSAAFRAVAGVLQGVPRPLQLAGACTGGAGMVWGLDWQALDCLAEHAAQAEPSGGSCQTTTASSTASIRARASSGT